VLTVDSGDLFFDGARVPDDRKEWAIGRADLIVRAFNQIGCAAFNVGDRDLAAGLDALKKLQKTAKFPFVSANLRDAKGNAPFPAYAVAEAAGVKVGFVGLMSAATPPGGGAAGAGEWTVADPAEAAKSAVAAAKKDGARFVVLLSQLRPEEQAAVLAAVPEIEVVLGSALPQNQQFLSVVGDDDVQALSYTKGKYLGVVTLHVQPGAGGDVVYRERGQALAREIGTLDARIRQQERQWERMAQQPTTPRQRLEYYERSVAGLVAEREKLVAALGEVAKADPKASFASFELVALGRGQGEDPAVKALVDEFKEKQPQPTAGRPMSLEARPAARKVAPIGAMQKGADPRRIAPLKVRPPSGMAPPVRTREVKPPTGDPPTKPATK